MSIFIKVWLDNSTPKLFCLREPQNNLGLDDNNQITFGESPLTLFNFIGFNANYLIINRSPWAKFDGQAFDEVMVSPNQIFRLEAKNFKCVCAVTSPSSELLARASATHCPVPTPKVPTPKVPYSSASCAFSVSYQLAGAEKTYSLPTGIEVSLGSSERDGIYLPIDGIRPGHLRFVAQDSLVIFPFGGPLLHAGQEHRFAVEVVESSILHIQPVGIQLNVDKM